MKSLIDIYNMAEKENIVVDCRSFLRAESMSHMDTDGDCYIAIDPMRLISLVDEKNKLAHELGHCVTGSFYNLHSRFDIRQRHEVRADRWAIEQFLSVDELNEAICNGICTVWDLAEYFDFSEQFIQKQLIIIQKHEHFVSEIQIIN